MSASDTEGTPPRPHRGAEAYANYMVPHLFEPWARDLLRRAGPLPGERILDAACGTGTVARAVLPLVGPEGRVTGADPNREMLAMARTTVPAEAPVEWREASAESLPFPDAAFDLVLCQEGLQFFSDRPAAVREFRRVLAPGGRLALSVWRTLEHNPVHAAIERAVVRHLGASTLTAAFSGDARDLDALLSGGGFEGVAVEPASVTARFPAPERFIRMSVLAGSAVLHGLARLDEAERASLVEGICRVANEALRSYISGDTIEVPTSAYVATARAPIA